MAADGENWSGAGEWARAYRALGLQVVPAARPAAGQQWKRPVVDWIEFQNALAPEAVFERWYGAAGAEVGRRNMGLICGAASAGLVVVDLDIQKGPEAMRWWRGLLDVHNSGIVPETWMQNTGGGGVQFFFRAPEGWTPPTFKTVVGVDIRGQGGFVVCPPSLHESGRAYEWDEGSEPWSIPLEVAPDWLCGAIDALRLEHGGTLAGSKEYVAPEGARNAFGLDTDGREHKMLAAVWAAVVDLRRDCPIPPPAGVQEAEIARLWSQYEQTTKTRLGDAASNGEGLEREGRGLAALRSKWSYAMAQWDGKVREASLRPRPSEPVAADAGATAGQASVAAIEAVLRIDVANWPGPAPERRWVVLDWLVEGAVNSLYGDGGLGKTLLAQQLAYAVGAGATWLGLPTTKGRVLGVFCEDDEGELKRRHMAIKGAMGFSVGSPFAPGDVTLWPRVGCENVLVRFDRQSVPQLTPFYAELAAALEELNPSLLILDTLADVYGGNEIDRPQVNYFVKTVLGGLIKAAQARGHQLTILLLGHPSVSGSAGGGRGYSGSTAWNNAVRARFYLTRPEDEHGDARVLTRGKANYAKSGDDTAIRLRFADGVLEPEDDSVVSHALEHLIRSHVQSAFERGEPYTQKAGHARNIYATLGPKLVRLGYEAQACNIAIGGMMRGGVLVSKRCGDGSGLKVAQ